MTTKKPNRFLVDTTNPTRETVANELLIVCVLRLDWRVFSEQWWLPRDVCGYKTQPLLQVS